VLNNILNSEYMDVSGDDERIINWPVWSFSVTNEEKKLAGALGSLVKKGLVFCGKEDGDEICGLTREGYNYINLNSLK
jgi:hypothetical protein